MLEIKEIGKSELPLYHELQIDAFADLYTKYQDTDTNPGSQTLEFLEQRFDVPGFVYLIFYWDKNPVGGAREVFFKK